MTSSKSPALLILSLTVGCASSPIATATGDAALDANASGDAATCVWNADCPADRRCHCETGDCACVVGARGAGKAGVDACLTGDECASALCVEGAVGNVCSGPCDRGCGDKLPGCADVSPLGRICVRTPPMKSAATGTFGARTFAFDAAYFGYDFTDGGRSGISLELQAGSDGTCPPPKKDPQATVVIAGLPAPIAAATYKTTKATLLGIDPSLPVKSTATSSTVTLRNVEPCVPADGSACAFELEVSLVFPEGKIAGSTRAIHCASMDVK